MERTEISRLCDFETCVEGIVSKAPQTTDAGVLRRRDPRSNPLTFRVDVGGALVDHNPPKFTSTARAVRAFLTIRQEPTCRNPMRIRFISDRVTKNIFHQFVDPA